MDECKNTREPEPGTVAAEIIAYFRSRGIEIEMEAFEEGEHRIVFYGICQEDAIEAGAERPWWRRVFGG